MAMAFETLNSNIYKMISGEPTVSHRDMSIDGRTTLKCPPCATAGVGCRARSAKQESVGRAKRGMLQMITILLLLLLLLLMILLLLLIIIIILTITIIIIIIVIHRWSPAPRATLASERWRSCCLMRFAAGAVAIMVRLREKNNNVPVVLFCSRDWPTRATRSRCSISSSAARAPAEVIKKDRHRLNGY